MRRRLAAALLRAAKRPALAALAALVLFACEKPDASHVTSPSALSLLGVAEGDVRLAAIPTPPGPRDAPGWEFDLGNARFSTLENGTPSIQVVTRIRAQPGATMEMWIVGAEGPRYFWRGGSTRMYDGTFCFQLALVNDAGEALQLRDGEEYRLVIGFVDPVTGAPLVVKSVRIAGRPPVLDEYPAARSVGEQLLGCPRSVI